MIIVLMSDGNAFTVHNLIFKTVVFDDFHRPAYTDQPGSWITLLIIDN